MTLSGIFGKRGIVGKYGYSSLFVIICLSVSSSSQSGTLSIQDATN